jgi:HK97 gp10 family phage protein
MRRSDGIKEREAEARMTIRSQGQKLVEITGDKELIRKFEQLANRDATRISRKVLTKGAAEMRDEIKFQIRPTKTKGHSNKGIKSNIGSRLKKPRKTNEVEALAGVGVGKKTTGARAARNRLFAPHFHLLALGTKDRYTGRISRKVRGGGRITKKTGGKIAYRGRMPADDFVGRAYAARGSKAVGDMVSLMKSEIEATAVQK